MSDLLRWARNQWDRVGAVVAVVLGGASLWIGYLGVSRSTLVTQQLPYLASGGLLGIFALGIGATLWLSADLRDEWRKLDEIHQDQLAANAAAAAREELGQTDNGRRRRPVRASATSNE